MITVFGSLNVDYVFQVAQLPAPGETVLATNMEVQQLQAIEHADLREAIDYREDLASCQPKLRTLTARFLPLARTTTSQLRSHTEMRAHPEVLANLDHRLQLLEAIDHDDRMQAHLLGEHRSLDITGVLVAIADDQPILALHVRQDDQQLWLAASFKAEPVLHPKLSQLFDNITLLVDLDREHRAIATLETRLADSTRKRAG